MMKKSMTDYVSALSGSNMEVFEDIIANKYRKFVKFFKIMKDYSEYITKLNYEFSDKNTLSIEITLTKGISLDDKKELLDDMRSKGYEISAKIKGRKIRMDITHSE